VGAVDAIVRSPPQRAVSLGRAQIADFFAAVPADGRLDLIDLVEVGANGQPALAAYAPDAGGIGYAYGIMVLDIVDGAIATITGFPEPELFSAFGLASRTGQAPPDR
jgi:RNA polymerase sigma-70 factor (ECF subfamily)